MEMNLSSQLLFYPAFISFLLVHVLMERQKRSMDSTQKSTIYQLIKTVRETHGLTDI